MLALVVAILRLNPKVPRRISEESNGDPNVRSFQQLPPLRGNPLSWEEKSTGKIPGNVALLGSVEAGD